MALDENQLQTIIDSRNFEALIGELESTKLECKAQPYVTDTDAGKRELAKDVSAFANAVGGSILIGIKTKPSDLHFGDEVEAIRPFPQSLVNTSQYLDILRAWVFPDILGMEVSWVATTSNATRGIVIIKIPDQEAGIKPFIITKTLDGSKQVETAFGYAQRKGDKNPPLEVRDLQRLLRSGIHYQEKINEQLTSILTLVRGSIDQSSGTKIDQSKSDQIESRIAKAIEHNNLKDGLACCRFSGHHPKLTQPFFQTQLG